MHSETPISKINARVIEAYVELGGSIGAVKREPSYESVAEGVYRGLQDLARQADDAGDINRASGIEQILAFIDRLTVELIDELGARTDEFDRAYVEARRISSLDLRIDAQKVTDWIEEQIRAEERGRRNAATVAMEWQEYAFLADAQSDVSAGRDPRIGSHNRIRENAEIGSVELVEAEMPLHVRLLEAMADPSMHRPAVQGSEAGGATPPPFRTEDSGAGGRLGEIPPVPGPSSSATAGTDAGELGRGMLEQPVVGSADEAHPGTAAPRSGVAQAMVTPELGAQATFWLRPVDPVPAPGTVRFDAGFHRAGQQPQHSGEAAMGGTTVHRPFVPTPEEMLDPNRFTVTPSWSEDAFEVERALIAGRLPPGFDSSRLMRQWPGLVLDTEIEDLLESGLLPTRAIDSMIERFRAVEGGRGHIQLIQQLEAMKKSIDRALTKAYGYRVDADWLATVDRFLKTGRPRKPSGDGRYPSRVGVRTSSRGRRPRCNRCGSNPQLRRVPPKGAQESCPWERGLRRKTRGAVVPGRLGCRRVVPGSAVSGARPVGAPRGLRSARTPESCPLERCLRRKTH